MPDSLQSRWEADRKMVMTQRLYNCFLPAIYGGVIGDALGVPHEFKTRNNFPRVNGMEGHGAHNQEPGTWSDDTSMTLCLIETLIENGDQDSLMRKFVKYYKEAYWTPFGKMFDIGITTARAIENYISGTPADKCGQTGERDNGNGALMRIAPLAFVMGDCFDFPKLVRLVEKYAVITHAHPRSTLGCIIYTGILFRLFHYDEFNRAFDIVIELCRQHLSTTKYEAEFSGYERIFRKNIKNLEKREIVSDGYVVHSLEAALWCCLRTNSFQEAVLEAVNLGGDTDTIGAITGTMAGAFYKIDGIPKNWLDAVIRKDDIADLLNRFCSKSDR